MRSHGCSEATSKDGWDSATLILSRYGDVLKALREPLLSPNAVPLDPVAHAEFRRAAKAELTEGKIAGWLAAAEPLAHEMLSRLADSEGEVDLAREFAEPWSLALAVEVSGAAAQDAGRLAELAADVFAASTNPLLPSLQARARQATAEMSGYLGDAFRVQAFAALSQTLPAFLTRAWLTLLQHPAETAELRAQPELLSAAMEELFRYAGPPQAQLRYALGDIDVNGTRIAQGERVVLMTASANRDPARFPQPDRLDLLRHPNPHLAFGWGEHACVGAALVRTAATAATLEFLHFFASATPCSSAVIPPVSLRVTR